MAFVAVQRGKFRQLARADTRDPVETALYALRVERVSVTNAPASGKPAKTTDTAKTYVTVDASDALGDLRVLRDADAFIRRAANPRFSPLVSGPPTKLTLKVVPGTTYMDDIGHPAPPFVPAVGDLVDAVIRPGAFGDFGYCLLVQKLKPHSTARHGGQVTR